ncbi:glycosyltransferase, partial [Bosea sp. (in: a-proteobacteria)]|uniref:glycosyltransferase n=1 Tax=Bosea sp. (in: a-proteobacteria) TaxID=1871050 RepID=UPI002FCBA0BB
VRLAFLTTLIPVARPDTGFEIANAAILEALRAAGHAVTAFGFVRPGEVPADSAQAAVIDAVDVENAVVSKGRQLQWLASALLSSLPVASAKLRLAGRGRFVEAVRARGPFDAIVLNSVMLPGAFPELTGLAPCVLVEHNIEHVSARQNAAHAGSALMRALFAREARQLERIERRLWDEARFVWTLAEEDRAALGPAMAGKSAVLPLVSGAGIEPSDLAPVAPAYDTGMIGTWTWVPNFTGLDWFLREVCPLLPADFEIAVAGRLPPDMPRVPPQVELVGRVPDAREFLLSCRALALASRAGTGVQLKTIEAMQLGSAAVATPLSCRGFTEIPANFHVAEEPGAFAEALVELVEASRAGAHLRLDGAAFMARQRAALAAALERGLAAAVG